MFDNLRRDAGRYRQYGGWFVNLGFWVVAIYRLGTLGHRLPRPLGIPLRILYYLIKVPIRVFLHVELPAAARIGPGLFVLHPFNIFVGAGTVIGRDCSLFHEVTIGFGPTPGEPTLEEGVVLFAGARVLGGITVGDRTEIGANCVVTRSVKPDMLVMLPPAPVVPQSLVRRAAPAAAAHDPASGPAEPPPRLRGGSGGAVS